MLCLSRKIGEAIAINGREVTITVLGIEGCRVRLGLEADADTPIYRKEVLDRIQGVGPEPEFMRRPLETR